jgi:aspartate/methionine/tyrosine aminotransferase
MLKPMNPLAKELNDRLAGSIVERLLSDLGLSMYFPKGIVAQSAEAKQRANRLNATIGMAYKDRAAYALPLLMDMLPSLNSAEAVAYAPTAGNPDLRKRWKSLQIERNPGLKDIEYSDPVVVAGLTSGIFQMAELFVNPGDRVIIPDMFWGNYRLIISERRQGNIDTFPFFSDQGGFNLEGFADRLKKSAAESKKYGGAGGKIIILLNFPNNPTGYSPSVREAERIAEIIRERAEAGCDILTVHDDAYFGLFYDPDVYRQSLFAKCANLHKNVLALKIDGATKEEYAWGFRVGFMSFASRGLSHDDFQPLISKLMGSIRATVSNCPGISQSLILKMLEHPEYRAQKQQAEQELSARYHIVKAILENAYQGADGATLRNILRPLPFNSGYFMAFAVNGMSAEDLRLALLDKGVGSIAIGDAYLRVAFAAIDQDELEGLYAEIFTTAIQLAEQ